MTTRKQIQDQAIRNSLINNKITHTMRKKQQGYPDLYKVTYKLRNISQGHVWNELENTKRTRIYIGVTKNV
tara:strand:+ start:1202 stop:1414 length:213 start_codon:yes stop_codon:yes gene_type:complete